MPGEATKFGPWKGGLHNSSGIGEYIDDTELFQLTNLEVDSDGTLVNRPEVRVLGSNVGTNGDGESIIGIYMPLDGRKYLVIYQPVLARTVLVNTTDGAVYAAATSNTASVAAIQYGNRMYVIGTQASTNPGGYFDAPTSGTFSWTSVAGMPRGESAAIYRERMFIACGISATANASRFFFSSVADPTTWAGADFIDVVPGNGQKLVGLVHSNTDLILFKENSTHKFTYTTDPRKAELTEVDPKIGASGPWCFAMHQNLTCYVMHDNSVYELFQYTYTRISDVVDMLKVTDIDLYASGQCNVSLFRDRVFVRFYNKFYVFDAQFKVWCTWKSTRKFSRVHSVPGTAVSPPVGFASSSSSVKPNAIYYFNDNRDVDAQTTSINEPATMVGTTSAFVGPASTTITPVLPAGTLTGDWAYLIWQGSVDTTTTTPVLKTMTFPNVKWEIVVPSLRVPNTFAAFPRNFQFAVLRYKVINPATDVLTLGITSGSYGYACITMRGGVQDTVADLQISSRWYVGDNLTTSQTVNIPESTVKSDSYLMTFGCWGKYSSTDYSIVWGNTTGIAAYPSTAGPSDIELAVAGRLVSSATQDNVSSGAITGVLTGSPATAHTYWWGGVNIGIKPVVRPAPLSAEWFTGTFTTKAMDLELSHMFKVLFWWGISVATRGKIRATTKVYTPGRRLTWGQAKANYVTWGAAKAAGVTWGSSLDAVITQEIGYSTGSYYRKFVKLMKKLRFRQIQFTVDFDVITSNGVADASLRVYDMTIFVKGKETVVKGIS